MHSGRLSLLCSGCIAVAIAMLLVIPVSPVVAAQVIASESSYDIPISELTKVKKKTPSKRQSHRYKKKQKRIGTLNESSTGTAVSVEPVSQAKTTPVESSSAVQDDAIPQQAAVAAIPISESENNRIYHTPYSFAVAGKRTVINAVISSKTNIQDVSCILSVTEGVEPNLVKMKKVEGTQFTYTATLPGLSLEYHSLRYTIVAVDSLGLETRSQEFVTPLTNSPVLPSWQLE